MLPSSESGAWDRRAGDLAVRDASEGVDLAGPGGLDEGEGDGEGFAACDRAGEGPGLSGWGAALQGAVGHGVVRRRSSVRRVWPEPRQAVRRVADRRRERGLPRPAGQMPCEPAPEPVAEWGGRVLTGVAAPRGGAFPTAQGWAMRAIASPAMAEPQDRGSSTSWRRTWAGHVTSRTFPPRQSSSRPVSPSACTQPSERSRRFPGRMPFRFRETRQSGPRDRGSLGPRKPAGRRRGPRPGPLVAHPGPQPRRPRSARVRRNHPYERIVGMDGMARRDVAADHPGERLGKRPGFVRPVGERRAVKVDPLASVDLGPTIQRETVGILADRNMSEQPRSRPAARDRTRWQRRLREPVATRAGEAQPGDAVHHKATVRRDNNSLAVV